MDLKQSKGAQTLWRILGIKPQGEVQGVLIHGQLHRDDFQAQPLDFKSFIRSV